jgi:hypothetical protein
MVAFTYNERVLTQEDKQWIQERFEKVETSLRTEFTERLEKVETTLLTEFHKWASPN